MILISGNPLDIAALSNTYPPDSVEVRVLKKMSQSQSSYRYDSIEQLKFELRLRKEMVKAAYALNSSKIDFAVFHKSRCNPEYWDRTPNGGFSLKNGARPSEAINDIFVNGHKYATECATAMVIVVYKALLETFGNSLFNELFPSIYLMNWHSLDSLIREFGSPRPVSDVLPGDRGYFKNPDVNPKTPEWQGENVIVIGDNLYYGHGIGLTTSEKIIRALNQNRISGSTRSAYFLDSASRLNYKKLSEFEQRTASASSSPQWRPFPVRV